MNETVPLFLWKCIHHARSIHCGKCEDQLLSEWVAMASRSTRLLPIFSVPSVLLQPSTAVLNKRTMIMVIICRLFASHNDLSDFGRFPIISPVCEAQKVLSWLKLFPEGRGRKSMAEGRQRIVAQELLSLATDSNENPPSGIGRLHSGDEQMAENNKETQKRSFPGRSIYIAMRLCGRCHEQLDR